MRRSPLPAFAEHHNPVSLNVRQVEVRQLGATQSCAEKNGKNSQVTPPTNGLVTPRGREKFFDLAGVNSLTWACAVATHMCKIAGTAEVFIGHLSQAPRFAQHTPQRREGEIRGCGSITGDERLAQLNGSGVVEARPWECLCWG